MQPLAVVSIVAFAASLTTAAVDHTWKNGKFIAVSGGDQYHLSYPALQGQPLIQRYENTPPLTAAWNYDVGQTLIIGDLYHVVMGSTELQSFQMNNMTRKLTHLSSVAYKDNCQPKQLIMSSMTEYDLFFYLEYVDCFFTKFLLGDGVIIKISSGVDELSSDVSTVTHRITAEVPDDVYVWTENQNTLVYHSPSTADTVHVPIENIENYCDQITALTSQPAIASDGKFSFTMKCINNSMSMHYHVTTSFDGPESLKEVYVIRNGTAVASSTHLNVYNGNVATVYDRRQLSNGVPSTYIAPMEIKRVIVYETEGNTHFLLDLPEGNLVKIDANAFFRDHMQGVTEMPNTVQGSADVRLPYAVVDGGILVTAKNGDFYEIVTLAGDELAEVARVKNIPDQPAFVTFIADPIPPTTEPLNVTPTSEATPIVTTEPTTGTVDDPTTPPTVTTEGPTAPAGSVIGPAVGGPVGAVVLIVILISVVLIGWLLKRESHGSLPKQEKKPGRSEMAHLADPTLPITDSGSPQPPPAGASPVPDVVVSDMDQNNSSVRNSIHEETGEGTTAMTVGKENKQVQQVTCLDLPHGIQAMDNDSTLGSSITSTPMSSRSTLASCSQNSSRSVTPFEDSGASQGSDAGN